MHICITEYQQGEKESNLYAGQKIFHSKYGRGIVVGFDAYMNDPVVFFYEPNSQVKFGKRVVITLAEELKLI